MIKLHSIHIINLDRRTDLKDAQIEAWTSRGYSPSQIVFHKAVDGKNYDSCEAIVEDAITDGFTWFRRWFEFEPDFWMGNGVLATMFSCARLVRYISLLSPNYAYAYVLADRYSKIECNDLDKYLSALPDFKFLQFLGYEPAEDDSCYEGGHKNPPEFAKVPGLPEDAIERGYLKIGDGVLIMTPAGASWMQQVCEPYLPSHTYEESLYLATRYSEIEPGVYSVYTPDYPKGSWAEEQFPEPLSGEAYSDIHDVNYHTQTGDEAFRRQNRVYENQDSKYHQS